MDKYIPYEIRTGRIHPSPNMNKYVWHEYRWSFISVFESRDCHLVGANGQGVHMNWHTPTEYIGRLLELSRRCGLVTRPRLLIGKRDG